MNDVSDEPRIRLHRQQHGEQRRIPFHHAPAQRARAGLYVLFLYREGYYNRDTENPNLAECIIAKNRHGETGTVQLQWQPEFTTFNDMEWQHSEF